MIFKLEGDHGLRRARQRRREVAADMFSLLLIRDRCYRGWKLAILALRCFISFILLSQNCEPQVFSFFRCWISPCSSDCTTWEAWLCRGAAGREVGGWIDVRYSELSSWQLQLSQERSYLAQFSSLLPAKGVLSARELLVTDPRSLLAAKFLFLMSEWPVLTMISDYLSDRSEMGCRLSLSLRLLLSQFSMIPSNLSLNFSSVYISVSCWALSSFCFWMSSKQPSIRFWRREFQCCRACMGRVSGAGKYNYIIHQRVNIR